MALKSKRHLGIHTEMLTDSMIELIECGAADNSCKAIHPGKTIATFAYGSKRMYDYIDHNPSVAILPVDYVNNPYTIAQNDNVVSVNAALEIDLSGQVCAESIGNHMFSGSGGQLDYVRGALMSRGGLSFIAFPSTAKGGTISKIKPFLAPGAGVTTGRKRSGYDRYGIWHCQAARQNVLAACQGSDLLPIPISGMNCSLKPGKWGDAVNPQQRGCLGMCKSLWIM